MLLSLPFLFSCSKKEDLTKNVSYVRQIEYRAEAEGYKVRAFYGYKETPFISDGVSKTKVYGLTFRLIGLDLTDVKYTVSLIHNQNTLQTVFKLDQVNHCLSAFIEIEDFNLDSFEATFSSGNLSQKLVLNNVVPKDTISYNKALEYLAENQHSLLDTYRNEQGEFNGEIHVRIVIRDNKGYWYVGLIGKDGITKALLVDGKTGEVLAVRKVA